MLQIMLNWLYIAFTTYCMGWLIARCAGKLLHYQIKYTDSILMAGLVMATVYAQIYSLFGGVSLLANAILTGCCAVIAIVFHKGMIADLREAWRRMGWPLRVAVAVLFVVWAYLNSRGYMVPDTQLYHAQSIRWIEEYGVVKGLAILNQRFAYNSSVFAVSALYSMKFLFGQSLHAINGWIAFVLSVTTLELFRRRGKFRWSDAACVGAVYYLTIIEDEVLSPSSDYACMCLIFFIVIKWLRLLEEREHSAAPYALLCVAGVYALTLKLTAGLILILTIKPAVQLIRERKWKEILLYLGTGLLVAVPWLARNVLISGWLFYPLSAIDLFDVPWKVDAWLVDFDAACIKVWGRGLNDSSKINVPITEWYGEWFMGTLTIAEKLIILTDWLSVIAWLGGTIWMAVRRKRDRLDQWLVLLAILCSFLYWQTSAPLTRYGYAYILLLPLLTGGLALEVLRSHRLLRLALAAGGVYKLATLAIYMQSCAWYPAYLQQVDYYSAEEASLTVIDGTELYYSDTEALGYAWFPGVSAYGEFELIGDEIEDGFQWVR